MAKKKPAAPKHVEPEDESQEMPEAEEPATDGKHVTKAEAIRRALAEGLTKYEDAGPFMKSQFGHDVTPGHFAASKSREKPAGEPSARPGRPKGAAKAKGERSAKPKAAVEGYLAPPEKPKTPGEEPDLLAALEAMKPLVAALGVDKVKRIADLLG